MMRKNTTMRFDKLALNFPTSTNLHTIGVYHPKTRLKHSLSISTMSYNDRDLPKDLDGKRQSMAKEAKELIKQYFPRKIKELEELLKQDLFKLEFNVSKSTELSIPEPPSGQECPKCECKCGKSCQCPLLYPNGPIDCNKLLQEIFDALLPHFNETLVTMEKIKLGLQLLVPKVEDGNNTGVEIQDEAITKVADLRDSVLSKFKAYANKITTRGLYIRVSVARQS